MLQSVYGDMVLAMINEADIAVTWRRRFVAKISDSSFV